jgi:DNA-directed RNA polymerase
VETELVADAFEQANTPLYRAVVRNAEARGLSPDRTAKAVGLANRRFNVVEKPWNTQQRLHLGTKLIELAIETLGIFEAFQVREGRRVITHRLRFTAEIDTWMKTYNQAAALTRPLLLPTLNPPKPWTSPRDSAYYSTAVRGGNLVTKPFPGQIEALETADLAPVYKGLNGIQATPWRINKRILAVMQAAWEDNLAGLPLPPRESEAKPEVPQAVKDAEKGSEVRREWRRTMRDWHLKDQREKNQRFEFQRALAIAEENADEPAIYFPHRLDFRGRAYAAGTTLQPQGPDECRALLEFAEGKPLGERGVFWLGVHGANLFGNDKVSLQARYEWAVSGFMHDAVACARDPLANRWWTEADKPWSFLAWCFDWAAVFEAGPVPDATTVSRMPIALDGSCNGLQHYSAMLRDEIGGEATNLVPSDMPSDIYGIVTNKLMGPQEPKKQRMANALVTLCQLSGTTNRSLAGC